MGRWGVGKVSRSLPELFYRHQQVSGRMSVDIYVALTTSLQADFLTPALRERFDSLGRVTFNDRDRLTSEALADELDGTNILVTGWETPQLTPDVLEGAADLELVVHTGGSIAGLATDELYDRGVTICSANRVMAMFVAEHVLGHMLAAERAIVTSDRSMRDGGYDRLQSPGTLLDSEIGFVGLGTVGRHLLSLLEPFGATVDLYDPYVSPAAVAEYDFVSLAHLEDALDSDIVSLHAARTPETVGMIGADELARIPDGGLLVNTARAELVEEEPLLSELESGRIRAALDVYHEEPLPTESPLREFENAQLTPHLGGSRTLTRFTEAMLDELERHLDGRALQHEIPREQFKHMTR